MVFVLGYGNYEGGESILLLENMVNGVRMGKYNNFFWLLVKNMIEKVFKWIKCFVKGIYFFNNNYFMLK